MADITLIRREYGKDIPVKYLDQGDGTYAQRVALAAGAGTSDVTDRAARLVGGVWIGDSTLAVPAPVSTAAPAGTEAGLYVRVVSQPAGGASVDVSDRAARLLGVVYGSQAAQMKQTATNFNLAVEEHVGGSAIDPRAIRALTSSDVVDVSDRVGRLLGHVTVDNASLAVTGTFFQATQPVSIAAGVDVTDRVGRLLGHVTVDNASLAVTGAFFQATQPVSLAAAVDVSDRAARLLGVVYGSQGQQLKQTATNFNAQVEVAVGGSLIDPRSIRTLTISDVVSVGASVHPAGLTAPVAGRQVVTTAGTRVQLAAQACRVVALTAETDNTGYVVVGDGAVVAAIATRTGTPLAAGDTMIAAVDNMNRLWMDSTVSGDGLTWTVLA